MTHETLMSKIVKIFQGPTDRPTDRRTDRPTDGPTDRPTDGPTDIATYRAAIAAKKKEKPH